MTHFNKKCYLHSYELREFLDVLPDSGTSLPEYETEWSQYILPYFGDNDVLVLTDNTLYDIATTVDKYFPRYLHHHLNSSFSDDDRILNIMGWIVEDCCTFRFTLS